ncbi:MAG TPA: hypothetical protein VJS44_04565 [Pyrinomonadaceae bacterium]|nr:hypothetical protein [Pyrinomonadaceae bacterium]
MRRVIVHGALSAVLALCALAPAAMAKTKHSAANRAAVKKCNEEYTAALKEARTKKGKERQAAMEAARKARKDCISQAPQ